MSFNIGGNEEQHIALVVDRSPVKARQLRVAAETGDVEVVKQLLRIDGDRIGVDVEAADAYGRRAMHLCSVSEVMKLLLERNARKDALDAFGRTALSYAAADNSLEMVKLLLERGADKNLQSHEGMSALLFASKNNHVDIVKLLLEKDADKDAEDKLGNTALVLACGNVEIVKMLLEKGCDKDRCNADGMNVLISACRSNQHEVVQLLLERGAERNAKDRLGNTALIWASSCGHEPMLRLLCGQTEKYGTFGAVDNKAESNSRMDSRKTMERRTSDESFNVSQGVNESAGMRERRSRVSRETVENDGYTFGDERVDCDKDAQNVDGRTALHFASENGHVDSVRALIEFGASMNLRDAVGNTALHCASHYGHFPVVRALIQLGADREIANKEGVTPFRYACRYNYPRVAKLLSNGGIKERSHCTRCRYEDGSPKRSFRSHSEALREANLALGAHRVPNFVPLRVCACRFGQGWHLSLEPRVTFRGPSAIRPVPYRWPSIPQPPSDNAEKDIATEDTELSA